MKQLLKFIILLFAGFACTEEPVETVFFDLDTEAGLFICCEGNFMYGNGSLAFYNPQTRKVTNRIFYARNNVPPGDVVQSLAAAGDLLYLVVNNSGKIYGVDQQTVEFRGVVTGLTSPRYMHVVSERKAYVSDLYARHLTVIDPQTFEITGQVDLEGHTSEQMVRAGNHVFITSWANGQEVLVVDPETDQMTGSIGVPFQPRYLERDRNGKLWVLSEGSYGETAGEDQMAALSRINPQTLTVEQVFRFEGGGQASGLAMNESRDTLCFLRDGVVKMGIDRPQIPDEPFIAAGDKLFYSLAVDPSGNDVYVTDAIDYTQDAVVYRYRWTGTPVDTFRVGINPSGFLFRN